MERAVEAARVTVERVTDRVRSTGADVSECEPTLGRYVERKLKRCHLRSTKGPRVAPLHTLDTRVSNEAHGVQDANPLTR